MLTRSERGKVCSAARMLEMLEFRFGAFEAIAYASIELARNAPESQLPMSRLTAEAILEFGDDLRQASQALAPDPS